MRYKTCTVALLTLIVAVSLLLLAGNIPFSAAQQASRVISLTVGDVNGNAEIASKRAAPRGSKAQILATDWKRISPKASLAAGDHIRTDTDASLQLHLNDGTLLTMGGDSRLTIEELSSSRGSTPRTAVFILEQGTIATRQSSKILGQTVQIIKTVNGSVDTRQGDVEVYKPQQRYERLAALPTQWPLFVQRSGDRDQTLVTLSKGTAEIVSSGIGQIVTTSTVLPDTCLGEDGVQFTLLSPNKKVKIVKLPEVNGFELISEELFQVLFGTDSQANKIKIVNHEDTSIVDIEGTDFLEMHGLASTILNMNQLLTGGITGKYMHVELNCTDETHEGLHVDILGTDGNVTRLNDFGFDISRSPSNGLGAALRPTVFPTATPTGQPPLDDKDHVKTPTPARTPTAGPTSTPADGSTPPPAGIPTPVPQPGPTKIPVTHSFSRSPKINGATVTVTAGGNCLGPYTHEVAVQSTIDNHLPQIFPGRLENWVSTGIGSGTAPSYYTLAQDVTTVSYQYAPANQLETVTIIHNFCYNESSYGADLSFFFYVYDREGNRSNRVNCSGPLSGPVVCH